MPIIINEGRITSKRIVKVDGAELAVVYRLPDSEEAADRRQVVAARLLRATKLDAIKDKEEMLRAGRAFGDECRVEDVAWLGRHIADVSGMTNDQGEPIQWSDDLGEAGKVAEIMLHTDQIRAALDVGLWEAIRGEPQKN